MTTKTFCDRCGRTIGDTKEYHYALNMTRLTEKLFVRLDSPIVDLCDSCKEDLDQWLEDWWMDVSRDND